MGTQHFGLVYAKICLILFIANGTNCALSKSYNISMVHGLGVILFAG